MMQTELIQVPGLDKGWSVVRLDVPKVGDWYWNSRWGIKQCKESARHRNFILAKSMSGLRPFRDVSEFMPYRDLWVYCTSGGDVARVERVSSNGVYIAGRSNIITWAALFSGYKFSDGLPCGVAE